MNTSNLQHINYLSTFRSFPWTNFPLFSSRNASPSTLHCRMLIFNVSSPFGDRSWTISHTTSFKVAGRCLCTCTSNMKAVLLCGLIPTPSSRCERRIRRSKRASMVTDMVILIPWHDTRRQKWGRW